MPFHNKTATWNAWLCCYLRYTTDRDESAIKPWERVNRAKREPESNSSQKQAWIKRNVTWNWRLERHCTRYGKHVNELEATKKKNGIQLWHTSPSTSIYRVYGRTHQRPHTFSSIFCDNSIRRHTFNHQHPHTHTEHTHSPSGELTYILIEDGDNAHNP